MNNTENNTREEEINEKDYKEFESILCSSTSSVKELAYVCMTLAHEPTKRAQDLLAQFKASSRGHEIDWLDLAIEEGQDWYLDPTNDREERDYLALKMMQEIFNEQVEIRISLDDETLALRKMEIEHSAIRELAKKKLIPEEKVHGLEDLKRFHQDKHDTLKETLDVKEKIYDYLKESIQTERYKDLDPSVMENIHFTR